MSRLFKAMLFSFIGFALIVQSIVVIEKDNFDLNSHLAEFSHLNEEGHYHHDNIDDNQAPEHSHTHKHSEEGEEHEHHHEHTNIVQYDLKVFEQEKKSSTLISSTEIKNGFSLKAFFSKAHPQGIFRPPIS